MSRKLIVPSVLVLALLALAACQPGDALVDDPSNPDEPVSSDDPVQGEPTPQLPAGDLAEGPAYVDSVDVLIMESFPVQVALVATGSLPDACSSVGRIDITGPEDFVFTIAIISERPADAMCAQVLTPFEQRIDLPVVGLAAGSYTVTVNGVEASFTLDVDNTPIEG
jgi:inhibitor of cysteine peptidase